MAAKPILYGVSDFVLMRTRGAYYIDRTAYIRELENSRYVMFLRPRRFGNSLLVSMLQCYYDIHYADRFDELFGGLAIHDDPTPFRWLPPCRAQPDCAGDYQWHFCTLHVDCHGGRMRLVRLVIVFQSGNRVLCEAV